MSFNDPNFWFFVVTMSSIALLTLGQEVTH